MQNNDPFSSNNNSANNLMNAILSGSLQDIANSVMGNGSYNTSTSNTSGNGTGFAGDARGDGARRQQLRKEAKAKENETVKAQTLILKQGVARFSPSTRPGVATAAVAPNKSDIDKDKEELLRTIKSVIRNQADWASADTKRLNLYKLSLDCVQAIIQHAPALLGNDDDEESLLFAFLEMTSTAELVVKHDHAGAGYSKTAQNLSQRVLAIKDSAIAAARKAVHVQDLAVVDNHAIYRQALRPLAFDVVHELKAHTFQRNKDVAPNVLKRILKELGTYRTMLPVEFGSSIFVRAVESRMSMLRCLIIGPEGTPYENGCFFFDIYLDNYPSKPPKVQFLTTGGGRYRFNPNLYNCGKVCLSLLGTWSGPGWKASESTLLQVLVSIQSLILVPEPYFNEPGFQGSLGSAAGTRQSNSYNATIRQQTIDAAILPHLRRIALGEAAGHSGFPYYREFDEIIEKHFTLKERNWKKQLSDWCSNSTGTLNHLRMQCIDAWEQRPQKKRKAKKQGARSSTLPIQKNHRPNTNDISTREVDGVIEIVETTEANPHPKVNQKKPASARSSNKTERNGNGNYGGGVIEIDDDDDDDLYQQAILNSLMDGARSGGSHKHSPPPQPPQQANNAANQNDDIIDLT